MAPIWMRTTVHAVEIATAVVLIALAGVIIYDALRLGPGWGEQGPQPGFFPFSLAVLMVIGSIGVLYATFRKPNRTTFFEVNQEVVDLLKVGIPVAVAVFAIRWLGLYLTSGLYIGFFMFWYGRFRWYWALFGAIVLPLAMWLVLRQGFNIPMPMSVLYRQGILPI